MILRFLPILAVLGFVQAGGQIEFIVNSTRAVQLEVITCPVTVCDGHGKQGEVFEVPKSSHIHFHTKPYDGVALEQFDLHLRFRDPSTKEGLLEYTRKVKADNEWRVVKGINDSTDFDMEFYIRNKCDETFYGHQCNRRCHESKKDHWECTRDGLRQCAKGWKGKVCDEPKCKNDCNSHGVCAAPNKCVCSEGFVGNQCEMCIPRRGCAHGQCVPGIPGTCRCHPGFKGSLCNQDTCSFMKPCLNNGTCSVALRQSLGYQCKCSMDFTGTHCEKPISQEHCTNKYLCKNGGSCVEVDSKTVKCECVDGYFGKFCENGRDCSTLKCSEGSSCHMISNNPICMHDEADANSPNNEIEHNEDGNYGREAEIMWILVILAVAILSFIVLKRQPLFRWWNRGYRQREEYSTQVRYATRRQISPPAGFNFPNALPPMVVQNNAESTVYDETPPPSYSSLDLTQLTGYRGVDRSDETEEMSENAENAEREIRGRAERGEEPERAQEVDDAEEIVHTLF
ncbi:hypothetical protein B9Z55_026461 [Caenorhabditis nigoni]|uniref:Delta-like protein n=1 Tax=Caenorhabditis nigoni TaxID=1611254 RepID=A0A2G5T3E9_9PELO|nr:hypothetical protein B9Z55_026461 [Caenorhabditis nigoni]